MNSARYGIILVYSTSHALKGERVLKAAGIPHKLIPVPRHISSDCGSCLRVARNDMGRARDLLEAANVGVEGTHEI